MRRLAFTLIELLVVIAIIAILAAILFPVFAQAKATAKSTAALSNIKQTMLGSLMYASDYDDINIPWEQNASPWTPWTLIVQPYLKSTSLLFDPARQVPWVPIDPAGDWGWNTTLAINFATFASNPGWGTTITQTGVENINDRIAFSVQGDPTVMGDWNRGYWRQHWFDAQRSACPDIAHYKAADPSWGWQYSRLYQGAKDYHNLKLVSAFGDGHAKAIAAPSVMLGTGTDIYGDCEETHFHAYYYDGSLTPTAQDLKLMKFWGKWWDLSY